MCLYVMQLNTTRISLILHKVKVKLSLSITIKTSSMIGGRVSSTVFY